MSFTILPPTLPPQTLGPDATPPDDHTVWREGSRPQDAGLDPSVRNAAMLRSCEEKLDRAFQQQRPRKLLAAIGSGGCTALKSTGRDCAKCRVCPSEEAWSQVAGYYRADKGKIFICAEKEPTARQVEDTLTRELVHAYDHCRYGMRVPFVGWQAPWALECAASTCSEVRAALLGSFHRAESARMNSMSDGFHGNFELGSDAGVVGGDGGTGFDDAGFASADANGSFGSFGTDGNLPNATISPPVSQTDPDELRNAVYTSALTSITSPFSMNRCRGRRDARSILDAVFDVCITDAAPIIAPRDPKGSAFPPMPPEVAAAEQGQTPANGPGGATTMLPPPQRVPPVSEMPQAKWGEA